MMNRVNTVLVGNITKEFTGTNPYNQASGLAIKDIVLATENGTTVAAGYKGPVKFGEVVDLKTINGVANYPIIKWSQVIQPKNILKYYATFKPYQAPALETVNIKLNSSTALTIVPGNRYVLRIKYKNVEEMKGEFTKSYEVIATAADTKATVAQKLSQKINDDASSLIVSDATTASVGNLKLTAKPHPTNVMNTYAQYQFDASLYTTNSLNSIVYNNYYEVALTDGDIMKVPADKGDGYWEVVRDRENEALEHKGIYPRMAFPNQLPDLMVEQNVQYDTFIVEYDNEYLSPDNQYVKRAPLTVEIYADSTKNTKGAAMITLFKAALGLA